MDRKRSHSNPREEYQAKVKHWQAGRNKIRADVAAKVAASSKAKAATTRSTAGHSNSGDLSVDINRDTSALAAYSTLCNNPLYSDITFAFETADIEIAANTERIVFYGHKAILAARSEVFAAMFQFDQNSTTCNIVDIDPEIFNLLMKYVYSEEWSKKDNGLTVEIVWNLFYAADKYMIPGLISKCVDYLSKNICPDNIHFYLKSLNLLKTNVKLTKELNSMIEEYTEGILENSSLLEIEEAGLWYILANEHLSVNEVEIFDGLVLWAKERCRRNSLVCNGKNMRAVLEPILSLIRFPTMTVEQFTTKVVPEAILTPEEELWVYRAIGSGGGAPVLPGLENSTPNFCSTKRTPRPCAKCGRNEDECRCGLTYSYYLHHSEEEDTDEYMMDDDGY